MALNERDPTDGPVDVTVVIPHLNDFARLNLCLGAISAQRFSGSREVIVADNGSEGGRGNVMAVVADRARVVIASEKGAGAARNAGVAAARGRDIAFIDSDCLPEPDWLAAGIAALGERSTTIVGGRVTVFSMTPRTGAEAFETVFAFDNGSYVRRKKFTVTANMFVSRKLFDCVGPFCTGISEDVEWCWRAVSVGARIVYAPEAVVMHPARRDWIELKAKWNRLTHEMHQLYRSRGRSKAWILLRTWAVLLGTPSALVRLAIAPQLNRSEAMAGALTLIRLRLFRLILGHRLVFERLSRHNTRSQIR